METSRTKLFSALKLILGTAAFLGAGIANPALALAANDGSGYAPLASCSVGEKDGALSNIVFHLSGFDSNGTRFYRAITSNLIEIAVKSDGSVESDANPCRDELVFFSSTFEATNE